MGRLRILLSASAAQELAALGAGMMTAGPPESFEPMGIQVVDGGTGSGTSQSAMVRTQGRLQVYADDTYCATIVIPLSPRGEERVVASIFVGLPDQPEACRREGARLTFYTGASRPLQSTRLVRGGTTTVIDNFAPPIICDGPGCPPIYFDYLQGAPEQFPTTGSGGLASD